MRATSFTRAMAAAPQNEHTLAPWRRSLDQAVTTGELYSRAVPITPVERCNDIGQVYGGPVVAVVDPNTYSAGDLFAAGFVDNQIGTLVSIGAATGGGGANVWLQAQVADALTGAGLPPDPLPAGIGYTIAVRRATRAGDAEGTAIEDLGVPGHRTYRMKKSDLVDGNRGLHNFCGRILAAAPRTRLRATVEGHQLDLDSDGLDRAEIRVDDRALGSHPLADDASTTVDLPPDWSLVEVTAYAGHRLSQRRLLHR
jgi:hypothetical protein